MSVHGLVTGTATGPRALLLVGPLRAQPAPRSPKNAVFDVGKNHLCGKRRRGVVYE